MLQLKIGRSPSCDITINDIAVSREHAEIFHDDDGNTFLTDLNSSNGTFVNGKRLEGSTLLKFNDIVKLGNSLLPWRNYLKGEIPTSDVPEFNEVVNITEFKDESKSEKENLNNASDKTKFRTASLIAVGGVLLSSVGLFLLFSGHQINWFSFAIFFFSFGVGAAIFVLILIWILNLMKISNTYLNAVIIVVGFFLAGYISFAHSKGFTNSSPQNNNHTPTNNSPTYDETDYNESAATISICSICGNKFNGDGFELTGNGDCKKVNDGSSGFYCSCECVSEAQSNSDDENEMLGY
jgi:hypothetical protein